MTTAGLKQLLAKLARAWTERRYEDAVAAFAPGVRYLDPLRYSLEGRARLLRFFQDDGGLPQATEWRHVFFDEPTQVGAAEYSYRGSKLYHGVVLIRFEGDLITHWREYQHTSESEWQVFFKGAAF